MYKLLVRKVKLHELLRLNCISHKHVIIFILIMRETVVISLKLTRDRKTYIAYSDRTVKQT